MKKNELFSKFPFQYSKSTDKSAFNDPYIAVLRQKKAPLVLLENPFYSFLVSYSTNFDNSLGKWKLDYFK